MPQTNATIDFICIIKQRIEKKIIKKKNDQDIWFSSYIVYDQDRIDLKVKLWGVLAEAADYQ